MFYSTITPAQVPVSIRSEVRYALSIGDYARLARVAVPMPLYSALEEAFHSEDREDGYGAYCFVCGRSKEHRGEHSDWQYVAKVMRLI